LQFTWNVATLNYPVVCELYYVALNVFKYMSPILVFAAVIEQNIKEHGRKAMQQE
jgi:hypothetical protein